MAEHRYDQPFYTSNFKLLVAIPSVLLIKINNQN